MKDIIKLYDKFFEKLKILYVWFINNVHTKFNMTPKKYALSIFVVIMVWTGIFAFFNGHCINCEGLTEKEIITLTESKEIETGKATSIREFLFVWIVTLISILTMIAVPIIMVIAFSFTIYIFVNKLIKRR